VLTGIGEVKQRGIGLEANVHLLPAGYALVVGTSPLASPREHRLGDGGASVLGEDGGISQAVGDIAAEFGFLEVSLKDGFAHGEGTHPEADVGGAVPAVELAVLEQGALGEAQRLSIGYGIPAAGEGFG